MGQVYRVIAAKLRIQRGPGRPDLEVERPYKAGPLGSRVFRDSEEAPTTIEFDEFCIIDLDSLIRIGALIPTAGKRGKRG